MIYHPVTEKDWLIAANLIRKTIEKDKVSYRLLFHIFWILSVVMVFIIWPVTFITIPAAIAFLYYSKANVILYLSHLTVENKQIIETKLDYGEDSEDISEERKTLKQFHLDCKTLNSYEIETQRLKEIDNLGLKHVIVNQDLYDRIEIGDEIDVIICSTNNLYAYNIGLGVYYFYLKSQNTTDSVNLTFIDQQNHLRSNMPKFN